MLAQLEELGGGTSVWRETAKRPPPLSVGISGPPVYRRAAFSDAPKPTRLRVGLASAGREAREERKGRVGSTAPPLTGALRPPSVYLGPRPRSHSHAVQQHTWDGERASRAARVHTPLLGGSPIRQQPVTQVATPWARPYATPGAPCTARASPTAFSCECIRMHMCRREGRVARPSRGVLVLPPRL